MTGLQRGDWCGFLVRCEPLKGQKHFEIKNNKKDDNKKDNSNNSRVAFASLEKTVISTVRTTRLSINTMNYARVTSRNEIVRL